MRKKQKKVIVLVTFVSLFAFTNFLFNNFYQKDLDNIIKHQEYLPKVSAYQDELKYFKYYKSITIDHNKVNGTENLINFPLLISIFDSDLHINTQPDGDDIAFSNGSSWLDHEIEQFNQNYNATHAQLIAWVRIPSLSPTTDTTIYMYYGNSTMTSRQNPNGVWDNNFVMVQHLHETSGDHYDSTSNNNDGTPYGSLNQDAIGKIDGADDFDGSNDQIAIDDSSSLNITNAITIEAWINVDVQERIRIVTKGGECYVLRTQYNGDLHAYLMKDSTLYYAQSQDNLITTGTYHHVILTWDGVSGDHKIRLFHNGYELPSYADQDTLTYPLDTSTGSLFIGSHESGEWWDGKIDEVRISNIARSANWINTEYNNQYSPNSFYAISAAKKVKAPSVNDFQYYKEITIDHTKVSGSSNLINFPLLISIFDSDLHDHAQVDGDDIAFYSEGKWLDHEIEIFNHSYSGTQAQLITWIRIPSLSSSIDTNITMYYGNSTMGSQENPSGVWDPNFVGVWHLDELGTGAVNEYVDSGHYGNHGQGGLGNVSYVPDRTVGTIGFGQDFVDNFIDCGNATSLDITTNQITMQLWMKYPATHPWMGPFNHKGYSEGYRLVMDENSQYLDFQLPGDESDLQTSQIISTDVWHYVVATYNGSLMRIYVDGVPDSANLTKLNNIESALPAPFRIGHGDHPEGVAWSYPWLGQIDEVRISNIGRSAAWIATEYNNQYSPETFLTLSAEYSVSQVPPTSKFFNYYKVITVDHTKVNGSGSHTNFPLLISILDEDLHDHVLSGGNDIAFAIGNEWLDHEIELFNQSYSSTQAQLIAWVRIPSLSTSIDTQITMYYGNSTIGSQENPMGVWDKNFIGVWHLNEMTGGTNMIKDSTSNENHGTDVNNPDLGVNGKIGKGVYFDGNPYIDCGNDGSLDITNEITIEVWTNAEPYVWESVIAAKGGEEDGAYSLYYYRSSGSNDINCYLQDVTGSPLQTGVQVTRNDWMYTVLTYNGSSIRTFKNGDLASSDLASGTIGTNTENFYIGYESQFSDTFLGYIDEIRLSNVSRSAEWIATEYNNQYDPDNFYSIGIENQNEADTSAPDVTINSPNPNDLFGSNAPDYDLTVIDANLDSIWYSLDGGTTNSTPVSASGTIDQTMWSAIANGTVTIRFYANDTLGHVNYEEVTVRKDVINPSIIINSPTPSSSHSTPPSYSLSITEANIDEIWYTLDGGTTNYTGTSSGTIDSTAWGNAGLGAVTITFYVNDSVGNWNFTSVGIIKTSDLSISINTPKAAEWFNSNPDYEVYVNGNDRDSIWYTIDNGINNYTITNNANQTSTWFGVIDATAWSNAGQGSITLTFYLNNTYGIVISDSLQINRDTIDPLINSIESPLSGAWFNSDPPDYSLTITEANLEEIWYTLDGGTTNYTGASSGTIDATAWSNAGQGSVTITFYVNDSAGNWDSSSVIINRDTIDPSIDSIDLPLPDSNHSAPPSYSLSITETNLDDIWYTLDGGLTNYTGALSGTIDSIAWGNAGLGAVTITFYVNDSVNNWDSASVAITKTSDLSISINSPNIAQWFSSIPDYDVYVSGNDRDSIWYTLDNGITNFTITSTANLSNTWLGLIDSTVWSNAGEGSVTINFYLNNTFGIILSDSVQINKDTIDPTIYSIDSPAFGVWFNSNPPDYSLSITEVNLDEIWYTLDGGTTNYTGASSGTIDSTAWSNAGEGSVTIIFYVNDSAGNWDSASVIINRDSIDPLINSIDSPLSGAWFNSNPPDYSLTITEAYLDEIWYTLDGGAINYTGASSGTIDVTAWSNAGEGSVTIIFYVNDSAGNWDSASVMINRDSIDPAITIIKPNNYDLFGTTPPNITINIYDSNLDFSWYQLDNGTVITNNYTWAGFIDQSVWDQVGNGTVIIRFYANDTVGNLANAEVTVYKDIYLPIITIINPKLNEIYNGMAPSFNVSISGSNLDSTWYNLNNGLVNYTFTGLTGYINQSAWTNQLDGTITIKFYINNTLGVLGFDEINIIKDTIDPSIDSIDSPSSNQWFSNILPTYSLSITEVNLDEIWYTLDGGINNYTGALSGTIDSTAWSNAAQGAVTMIFYVSDLAGNWNSLSVVINRDTVNPSMDNINSPSSGSSHSSPPSYSLSITETNLNEIWYTLDGGINNYTGALSGTIDSTAWSNAAQGTVTIIFYVSDFAGNWDSASVEINKEAASQPSQPPEFPIWIIFVIIGAAIGGVVGIIVLKKSKGKKEFIPQVPEKKPVSKIIQEVPEEISQLDYDILSVMNHDELIRREEKLLEHIRQLEANKKYGKAAEFIGELILIENILGNYQEVKLYRQKQIDMAVRGLEYLKDQYEIESKKAALSGDYSKALELFNESKIISNNLKRYMEHQESSDTEENIESETMESQPIIGELEIVYSCMNDLLTKYFDDIGIKYYSNPQIYEDIQAQVHGLILADQFHLEDIDLSMRERIKSIQIIFTEDMSDATVTYLCQTFYNPDVLLIIVGIKWPMNVEAQIIEIPPNLGEQYQENIRIIHYELFMTLMGLTGAYETAFKEIINLYNKSEIEILRETQESSEIINHNTDELRYDLKEKGLIMDKLEEYFNR